MRSRLLVLGCVLALGGCSDPRPAPASEAPAAVSADAAQPEITNPVQDETGPDTPAVALDTAAGTLELHAGEFSVGSRPGIEGRNPRREAALVPMTSSAFDIDRRPFPGDGEPRRGLNAAQAVELCEQRGRRLCTELEWERACKQAGDAFETSGPEWTRSPGGPSFGETATRIVRGEELPSTTRCSARRAFDQDATPRALGFRCCGGEPNLAPYPEPERARAFRPIAVEDARLRELLAGVPELTRYAADFRLFRAVDAARANSRCRGTPNDLHGWEQVDGVLEWAPSWGLPSWVFAGRSGDDAMLIVLQRTARGFVHGASFIYQGEPSSVAIRYTPASRQLLRFSSSPGCVAEEGTITAEPDGRVLAYHRRVGW
ncbi:MAG: hypothetical protein GXP55_25985 [Deltaproteobacteria bacterium]|nr:hypothetical protein [Deltaproteobacteria bacterium]